MKLFLALLILSSVSIAAPSPLFTHPCPTCKKPAVKANVKPSPKPSPKQTSHYGHR